MSIVDCLLIIVRFVVGDRKKLYFIGVWNRFTCSIRSADLINREAYINQQTNRFFFALFLLNSLIEY